MSRTIHNFVLSDEFHTLYGCDLILAGRTEQPPGVVEDPHSHDFWEMIFIERGQGVIRIAKREYAAERGALFIYPPQVEHCETSNETRSLSMRVLCFDNVSDMGFMDFWPLEDERFECIAPLWLPSAFERISRRILDEIGNAEYAFEVQIKACLLELMACLAQYAYQTLYAVDRPVQSDQAFRTKHFIDEHYMQKLSLTDIAAKTYVSVFYLSHLFKEHIGETPINYLVRLRIDKACQLLETTKMTVNEVCQAVGYEDLQHFSNVFRKRMGVSPRQWKARFTKP